MSKKKIAHEAPVSLFDFVQERTSYDYCLVHLFAENEQYRDKILQAKAKGREIILDTSVFELGEAFDENQYLQIIEELKPDCYIVPDVLEDAAATCAIAQHWSRYFIPNLPGKPIGVVQGKDYKEIAGCYTTLDKEFGIAKIAISFDYSYYRKLVPHPNKLTSWMLGRVTLLGMLQDNGVINESKPHHLLGVALPIEGKFYGRYKWIDSVDTSNPVLHAIKGMKYQENFGLYDKEHQKLFELINYVEKDESIRDTVQNIMEHNIQQFDKYWNFETF